MSSVLRHNMLPGSLELAYLGDSIYDLYVRRALVLRGGKVHTLHHLASEHVCAHGQSEAFALVEGLLSEEELSVVKRARNAHQNPPRNADASEYHRATGFEALIGYLSLKGRNERIEELMRAALPDFYSEEETKDEE